MVIKLIKYSIAVTLGVIIGFYIQNSGSSVAIELTNDIEEITTNNSESTLLNVGQNSSEKSINDELKTMQNDAIQQINHLSQQLKEKDKVINELKKQLEISPDSDEPTTDVAKLLRTISFADFRQIVDDSLQRRFNDYLIQLDQNESDEINLAVTRRPKKNDWNEELKSNIHQYIKSQDQDNLHFVEDIICNSNLCRLKVQSDDHQHWKNIYYSMTRQDWFDSPTIMSKSNDPNVFVYFISKPIKF
ncbi:MAG: hypothetical protein OEY19_00025 [Gammaproteobacteria bacterium]|nr:hypothetical protein [Gammaproteobacteria bacterium]